LIKETLFEVLSDKKATIESLQAFMKAIKFYQDLFDDKKSQKDRVTFSVLPVETVPILSYACAFGTSLSKVDLVIKHMGGL